MVLLEMGEDVNNEYWNNIYILKHNVQEIVDTVYTIYVSTNLI